MAEEQTVETKKVSRVKKLVDGAKESLTGQPGSILYELGRLFLFVKESITMMNEAIKTRRNQRDDEKGGS